MLPTEGVGMVSRVFSKVKVTSKFQEDYSSVQ